MKALGPIENPDKASPAEQSRMIAAFAEVFEAMQVGSMEAVGIEIADPTDDKQATGRIARIAYTGGTGSRPSDMRVEGLDIGAKDGKARIGLIAFTGFSFAPTFAELRNLGDKPITEIDGAALRRLIPTIGTIRISGMDFDVPNEASKEPKPENIKFTLGDLEVTADKPLNGIPTNLRLGVQGFRMAIPPDTKEEGLQDLAQLGYRNLDLSWVTAASWNEAGNELVVREMSFSGAQMGSTNLRGTFGGVTKDVFNPDNAVALVALFGATVKNAEITIENRGLFEKLLEQEAQEEQVGRRPAQGIRHGGCDRRARRCSATRDRRRRSARRWRASSRSPASSRSRRARRTRPGSASPTSARSASPARSWTSSR